MLVFCYSATCLADDRAAHDVCVECSQGRHLFEPTIDEASSICHLAGVNKKSDKELYHFLAAATLQRKRKDPVAPCPSDPLLVRIVLCLLFNSVCCLQSGAPRQWRLQCYLKCAFAPFFSNAVRQRVCQLHSNQC